MPNLTIYLPDDVDERLRNRPDINKSAVCAEALKAALATPAQAREGTK